MIPILFEALEEVARQLAERDPHFQVSLGVNRWKVDIFVRPIDHPDVEILTRVDSGGKHVPFGVIQVKADSLEAALLAANTRAVMVACHVAGVVL